MKNIEVTQLHSEPARASEKSTERLTSQQMSDVLGGGDQAIQTQNARNIKNNNYDFSGLFGNVFK